MRSLFNGSALFVAWKTGAETINTSAVLRAAASPSEASVASYTSPMILLLSSYNLSAVNTVASCEMTFELDEVSPCGTKVNEPTGSQGSLQFLPAVNDPPIPPQHILSPFCKSI